LKVKGQSLDQYRGMQDFDGASTLSGAYGGVQKFFKDKQPLAVYAICAAQNLNFVINDAVPAVPDAQALFTTFIQELYAYVLR
jgi:hypothetical protein